MKKVYLDCASTTPMDPEVKAAMEPYFSDKFGNPGAMHSLGQEAQAAVDKARQKVADFLGCNFTEIIFTGSATESNNLAIRGMLRGFLANYSRLILGAPAGASEARPVLPPQLRGTMPKQASNPPGAISQKILAVPHIITSAIEHKSVLETCKDLEKDGVEVTYLPVSKEGIVDPENVAKAIKGNTVLVSIGYVNNEIGTIQPIREIAKIIKAANSSVLFHTDAVQAVNYLDCNVEKLGIDLLTFSGHKIYGPKGIGGLYIKKNTSIAPIITGGNQERGFRSGTENVPYIVGVGRAVELAGERKEKEAVRLQELRDYFIDKVLKEVSVAELNGSHEHRIANNANLLFKGVPANNLLIALDQEGIAASSGSTCSIKTIIPSHVISALGRSDEEASQSIRFTLGRGTAKEVVDYTISALQKIIKRMKD